MKTLASFVFVIALSVAATAEEPAKIKTGCFGRGCYVAPVVPVVPVVPVAPPVIYQPRVVYQPYQYVGTTLTRAHAPIRALFGVHVYRAHNLYAPVTAQPQQ